MRQVLSQDEQSRIKRAVENAEGVTSGEIVPYVVGQSDRYPETTWKGAVIGAVIFAGIAISLSAIYSGWGLSWRFSGWGISIIA